MVLLKIAREILLKWRDESRYLLERKIFPKLTNKKILFVGCARYTSKYPEKLKKNLVWTIDIDPLVAQYGAKNHVIGDISKSEKYFDKLSFDIIFLVGVFGYGVDTYHLAEKTIKSCHTILKKKGNLVIQWSDKSGRDSVKPVKIKNLNLFERKPLFGYPSQYRTKAKRKWEFFVRKN